MINDFYLKLKMVLDTSYDERKLEKGVIVQYTWRGLVVLKKQVDVNDALVV